MLVVYSFNYCHYSWRERRKSLGRYIQEKRRAGTRFHVRKNGSANGSRKSNGPVNGQQKRSLSQVAVSDLVRLRRRNNSITGFNNHRD